MFDSLELLLQLLDDSAIYSLRNATARVRRVARAESVQKEMAMLQTAIAVELTARKNADPAIPF